MKKIGVIGAGPKAAALVSLARALTLLGYLVPKIVIFEKIETAANWVGRHGHTSGKHALGTPPTKDVAFPYDNNLGDDVTNLRLSDSWQAFLTTPNNWMSYGEWVDRGNPHPPHKIWADYLKWVIEKGVKSGQAEVISGEVVKVSAPDKNKWQITYLDAEKTEKFYQLDGLVLTGPGDLKEIEGQNQQQVFDCVSFWKNLDCFAGATAESLQQPIVVVGAGESAASIITELDNLVDKSNPPAIILVNAFGTIYSRGENYFENRGYTNADLINWNSRSETEKHDLINRTDHGVFSQASLVTIDQMTNLIPKKGRALKIENDKPEGTPRLIVTNGAEVHEIPASYVIVSIGFNSWSFLNLFEDSLKIKIEENKQTILNSIQTDLSVDWTAIDVEEGFAQLHLPMLASFSQGPGFPNLSCLGTLAERILLNYLSEKE